MLRTIEHNVFYSNDVECDRGWGGAISMVDGLIEGNLFRSNYATHRGGAIYTCNGTIIKNVIRDNHSEENGAGLSGCHGDIRQNFIAFNIAERKGGGIFWSDGPSVSSNILFANQATGIDGGAMYDLDGVNVEQNTIVGNMAPTGGGVTYMGSTVFRNNIIWGNMNFANPPRMAQVDQIDQIQTAPSYSCIQNWAGGGTGNTSADPQFITQDFIATTEMFDDFEDGNFAGWTTYGGTWAVVSTQGTKAMQSPAGTGIRGFYVNHSGVDYQGRFRYRRTTAGAGDYMIFRPRFQTSTNKRVEIRAFADRMALMEWNGSVWITYQTNFGAPTAAGIWYEVFFVCKGSTVEVWRRGENESAITKVLGSNSVALTVSNRREFQAGPNAILQFDDLGWNVKNYDYFLHLGNASPCIDQGDPIGLPAIVNQGVLELPFTTNRDFNDTLLPIDVTGIPPNFNGAIPQENSVWPFDIGAKEYPMPAQSSFWWWRF